MLASSVLQQILQGPFMRASTNTYLQAGSRSLVSVPRNRRTKNSESPLGNTTQQRIQFRCSKELWKSHHWGKQACVHARKLCMEDVTIHQGLGCVRHLWVLHSRWPALRTASISGHRVPSSCSHVTLPAGSGSRAPISLQSPALASSKVH